MATTTNPILKTAAVSAVLVFLLNTVVAVPLKAFIEVEGRAVPSQIRSPAIMMMTRVMVPIALLGAFRMVQDISTVGVAVPYLMSSISTLQSTKGRTATDAKNITDTAAKIAVARQTLLRVLTFMVVATVITAGMVVTGLKAVRTDIVKQVGFGA